MAARVFEEAGWIGREAILMTGINSCIYVLSTLPPWILVDRWGRRAILLSGAVIVRGDSHYVLARLVHPILRWPSLWVRQAGGCT